jgi:hypothetical protein
MSYIGRVRPSETTSSVLRSTYTGNGSTTTYALPGPVANETSIIATINGVTQQDAAYSTDGSNIIFDTAPASGDSIEIRTLSAVAMSYAPMAGSVVTGILADGAVTTDKIATGSITSAKIAAGAVVQEDIGTNVAGTGPAFFAYKSGTTQSITNSTFTKLTFNAFEFNTAGSMFSSSTFTPTLAGYYQISGGMSNLSGNTPTRTILSIFKNGSGYAGLGDYTASSSYRTYGSTLVYCNGSTDYIEMYVYLAGSSLSVDYGISTGVGYNTYFSASLVRAA